MTGCSLNGTSENIDSSTFSFHIKKAYQPTDDKTTLQSITALMKLTANMYLDEEYTQEYMDAMEFAFE